MENASTFLDFHIFFQQKNELNWTLGLQNCPILYIADIEMIDPFALWWENLTFGDKSILWKDAKWIHGSCPLCSSTTGQ